MNGKIFTGDGDSRHDADGGVSHDEWRKSGPPSHLHIAATAEAGDGSEDIAT
jgi:hypothetical protein